MDRVSGRPHGESEPGYRSGMRMSGGVADTPHQDDTGLMPTTALGSPGTGKTKPLSATGISCEKHDFRAWAGAGEGTGTVSLCLWDSFAFRKCECLCASLWAGTCLPFCV